MVISILLKIDMVKFAKNLHIVFIVTFIRSHQSPLCSSYTS